MEITLDIDKRIAFAIIGMLLIISATLAVHAIPNPGHGGDKVLIKIPSENNLEVNLQKRLNDEAFLSRHGDLSKSAILSPRPRYLLPHLPVCFYDCQDFSTCGSTKIDFNMENHQLCALSMFGNDPASTDDLSYVIVTPTASTHEGVATKTWDYDLQNAFTQINCIDSTGDFSSPPPTACLP